MNKETPKVFNWSRTPSREGIDCVYIASPNSYAEYGTDVTKEELANSLANWCQINELASKKLMFKRLFIGTLISIPFLIFIYNMIQTIVTMNTK